MRSFLQKAKFKINYFLFFYGFRSKVYHYNNLKFLKEDELLIATKRGLYLACNNGLSTLLDGTYYGVAKFDGFCYVFQNYNGTGRILKFSLKKKKIKGLPNVIIKDLSSGCHQIDIVGSILYITDTYHNRILSYDLLDKCFIKEYYPTHKLTNGRKDVNYNHINSIFYKDNLFYLMAHNETHKTGKNSQILVCDSSFKLQQIISTTAVNAHNVVLLNNQYYYCDSMNNTFFIDDIEIAKVDHFTRGMAISEERIYLGGSEYGERKIRDQLSGAVYIIDRKGNKLVTKIPIPTMVQEVRLINRIDFGLSQNG
jgi:hypothetical protein